MQKFGVTIVFLIFADENSTGAKRIVWVDIRLAAEIFAHKNVRTWFVAYQNPSAVGVNDPHIRQFHYGGANIWSSITFLKFLWRKLSRRQATSEIRKGKSALGNFYFHSDDAPNSFKPNK